LIDKNQRGIHSANTLWRPGSKLPEEKPYYHSLPRLDDTLRGLCRWYFERTQWHFRNVQKSYSQ